MIFPNNKTVPLSKDIGCSSTFLESLGISDPRTDLDTVLTAIDLALSLEIETRTLQIDAINARMDQHLASNTAHQAVDLVNSPSGNLAATNVQAALDELQSDVDTRALQSDHLAEVSARTAGDLSLQQQVDGERSPLRMTSSGTVVNVAGARSFRQSASGAISNLVVPNGSMLAQFGGASIDFSSGVITYSDSSTEAFDRIDFTANAGKYAKYAIVLLPGEPNTLLIIAGTSIAASPDAAEEPAFSGGIPIGFITVKDDGTGSVGTIEALSSANVAQAVSVGADTSGDEASPLDPNIDELFVYYTRSDFSLENKSFFGSTTGVDQVLGLKKIVLNSGDEFVSSVLSGPQFKSDSVVIDSAQARLLYSVGKTDKSPTVYMSRDGGSSWTSADVYLPGSETAASYHGDVVIAETSFDATPLAQFGAASLLSVSAKKVALVFSLDFDATVSAVSAEAFITGSTGLVRASLHSVNFGIPQSQLAASLDEYAIGSEITGTASKKTFSITPVLIKAGQQYAIVLEAIASDGDVGVKKTSAGTGANISSATNAGFGWTASGDQLSGSVEGAGADLVLKVVSSTDESEFLGFGVNYCSLAPESTEQGSSSFEDHVVTAAEAASGVVELSTVRFSPGERQLRAVRSGLLLISPDFVEIASNRVGFQPGELTAGEHLRFFVQYGVVGTDNKALSRLNALFDVVVGTTQQVADGIATTSSILDAMAAVPEGGTIFWLSGTYTGNLVINKTVRIVGKGYGVRLNGSLFFQSASNCEVEGIRVSGNIQFDALSSKNYFRGWQDAGFTLTDLGSANNYFTPAPLYPPTPSITGTDIDWSTGVQFKVTLNSSRTFTFSNAADGQAIVVVVTAVGGVNAVFPATVVWPGGLAPTQTANKTDIYTFMKVGSVIYGSAVSGY